MSEHHLPAKVPLILALLIGVCGDATLSMLGSEVVPFSLYPVIALVLAARQLYHYYATVPMEGNLPLCTLLSFLIGIFGHTAWLRVVYPELGSNFFSLIVMLLLLAWLSIKLGIMAGRDQ